MPWVGLCSILAQRSHPLLGLLKARSPERPARIAGDLPTHVCSTVCHLITNACSLSRNIVERMFHKRVFAFASGRLSLLRRGTERR